MSYTTHFLTNIYNLFFAQHQKIVPPSKLCKQSFFQNNIFDILIKLTFIFFIQNMSVLKKKTFICTQTQVCIDWVQYGS